MNLQKLRILGSSFTEEEYELYRFDELKYPSDAMRFMSHRQNNKIYRPAINRGAQQHFLEDKWFTYTVLANAGIPVASTLGLYHPDFGMTSEGARLTTPEEVSKLLGAKLPGRFVFKPRGGRKGGNIVSTTIEHDTNGTIRVSSEGKCTSLFEFLASLPEGAFDDYEGCYHGWLIQPFLSQHPLLHTINPHTINSIRVVSFLTADNSVQIHGSALRLGRRGYPADNWDKGGLSVFVDPNTGQLGRGVYKPRYGGEWTSQHPDTGEVFEGQSIPEWNSVIELVKRAARMFSGIRTVGWDIALTPTGPKVIEGNALWGLPVVQVHTRGYLTDEVRTELARYGATFPTHLRPLPFALLALMVYQWQRSRGPRLLSRCKSSLRARFH